MDKEEIARQIRLINYALTQRRTLKEIKSLQKRKAELERMARK